MSSSPAADIVADVVVVGAGIVGATCAYELTRAGLGVVIIDGSDPAGKATAACMGHIVVMDDSEAQFALTRYSQQLWDRLADELPTAVERDPCGTLWLAENDDELAAVDGKLAFYQHRGVVAEALDAAALRQAEPELGHHLLGALRVPGDSVIYPPAAVHWLLERSTEHARASATKFRVLRRTPVAAIDEGVVMLADGERILADHIIDAAGLQALDLLPPESVPKLRIRPRKGHLIITDRRPGFCRHELVELGYLASAHGQGSSSVAFNLQPRATGQMLLGSSRQYDSTSREVEPDITSRMIARGQHFLPRLGDLRAIRVWTGFRPATEDKLPLIGPVPGRPKILLAAGHEGLGITTSLGTARLLTDRLLGKTPAIDPTPYLPCRGQEVQVEGETEIQVEVEGEGEGEGEHA